MLKYGSIAKDLREAILSGRYRKGDVLPTESELCRKYGVSHPTVRSAYQILEDKGLIYREKGRGTFVKFQKKAAELTVGIVFDRPGDAPFIGSNVHVHARLEGMKHALAEAGHTAVLMVVDSEASEFGDLKRQTPAGVLDLGNTVSPALKQLLGDMGIPFIGVSGEASPRYDGVPYVLTDELPGAKEAVEHCVAAGYESFGFIGADAGRFARLDRFLAAHGKSLQAQHTCMLPPVPWYNATHLKPAKLALEFTRSRASNPALYFFSSDEVAYHYAALLEASGEMAGERFGIVGFGDYEAKIGIPEGERLLSTIRTPSYESGVEAVRLLLDLLAGRPAATKMVTTRFIKRKTTR